MLDRLQSPPWSAVERLIGDDRAQLAAVVWRPDIRIPARVLATAITRGLHRGFIERLTALDRLG